jgi:hypothetical protein
MLQERLPTHCKQTQQGRHSLAVILELLTLVYMTATFNSNGTELFKKCKKLFENQHLLLLRDI